MFSPSQHRLDCAAKQEERQRSLNELPPSFFEACTETDNKVLDLPLSELVQRHNAGSLSTASILNAYGKKVVSAQKATNCLAGIMIQEALIQKVPVSPTETDHTVIPEQRLTPLSGVPVSIKDCIDIEGYDTTVGYSSKVNHPASSSAAIVRLLHDAGAITHVKTTVPPGLLGLETSSDLFGRTSNPYNEKYVSGASTGGGGALLACRGSVIEIGTDLGGSIRMPAHFCGVYGMKSSAGRFPGWGTLPPVPGLESVATTCAPMSRRLDDLEEFWKRVMEMRPWEYDHTCVPLPWRSINLQDTKLKFGVVWKDGVIPPSPACHRALEWVCDALEKQGHEVVDFSPPSIAEGLNIGFQLCFGDGGAGFFDPVRKDEKLDPVMVALRSLLGMPLWIKKIMAMITRKFTGDEFGASMLETVHLKSPAEERALVVSRDEYRAKWHRAWEDEGFDFLLTVPHSLPAIPAGTAEKATLVSAGYMTIFNILDYVAGVLPVSFVDRQSDALPKDFMTSAEYKNMGMISKGAYSVYDADAMHGLPVGVQVVGRRFEEEKVLQGMKIVEDALEGCGRKFVPREF
ncbi:amidase signature domain-containing protein [Suillus clintonianus]|uniref:amidase signature domain-containing protein n=1 Tax=Suillus clintonianus TaxID=1904413 RepID=UPI001B87A25A|nr:amidase signature domain-containing protein [Suillus clintonianus]KAG2140696.1 amidase signature domain-containing protein [Suillus clintonianus]